MKLLLLDRPSDPGRYSQREVEFFGTWAQPISCPDELREPFFEPYASNNALYDRLVSAFRATEGLLRTVPAALERLSGIKASERFWNFYLGQYLLTIAVIIEDIKLRKAALPESNYIVGVADKEVQIPLPACWQDTGNILFYSQDLRLKIMAEQLERSYPGSEPVGYQACRRLRISSRIDDILERASAGEMNVVLGKLFSALSRRSGFKHTDFPGNARSMVVDVYHAEQFDFSNVNAAIFHRDMLEAVGKKLSSVRQDAGMRAELSSALGGEHGWIIASTLPLSGLEGLRWQYETVREKYSRVFGGIRKVYTHGHVFENDDPLRMLTSVLAQEGKRIISIQHGGGGGSYFVCSQLFLERKIADEYITWGKGYSSSPGLTNVNTARALPSYYLTEIKRRAEKNDLPVKGSGALLVVFEESRYVKYYYPSLFSDMAFEYFRRQKVLFDYFLKEESASVKVYPWDYGWGQAKWIKERYPRARLLKSGKFVKHAMNSELVVLDYNSTPLAEVLAMGMPFLATWPRQWFKGNELFEGYVERLKGAGVFFNSPDELISQYRLIKSSGIKNWWEEKERREIIRGMAHDFALTSLNVEAEWRSEFES